MKRVIQIAMACLLMTALIISIVPAVSVPAQAAERFVYKHVVVVGVDGMGNFHNNCDTPNMDRIIKNNPDAAWTDYCLASDPNISGPCWTSMLTGVNPSVHGITNAIVENRFIKYNNPEWPTLFKLIRESRPNATMGCYSSWIGPSNGMVEENLGVDTLWTNYNDKALLDASLDYIAEEKPEFFFVVFNDVDAAGHANNWATDAYYEVLTKVDGYVGQVYDAVEKAGMMDDTLFIITSDHGGWTNGHAVRNDDTKYTYFGAVGKSINGNDDLNIRGRDLAAIIAYAMNIKGNPNWDSYIPQNMFKDNMSPTPAPDGKLTAGHENIATPAANSAKALGKYIDMKDLKLALFFDGSATDQTGKNAPLEKGTVTYRDGYYGQAAYLYDGYVSVPDLKFGTDSFSIGLWMQKTNLTNRNPWNPAICGNKVWNSGANDGFMLAEWTASTHFNVGNGTVRTDSYNGFLEGTEKNWFHIIVSVDRPSNTYRLYYNFGLVAEGKLNDVFKGKSFDTGHPFNIGQDANGNYVHKTDSLFDDLLVFDGAITSDQIHGLYSYYFGKDVPAKPEPTTKPTTKPTTTKPTTAPTTEPTTVPPTTVPPTVPPTTQPTTNPTTIPTTVPVTQAPTVPDSGTNANVDGGLPIGGVIGVIAAVLVVAGVVAFIVIKKKK